MSFKAACGLAVCLVSAGASAQFVTVDFSSQFNMSRNNALLANGGMMPFGNQTFNGVPMAMGGTADFNTLWAWTGHDPAKGGTQSLVVNTNIFGATSVYSMINTFWGAPGPNSFLSIEFKGTGGLSQVFTLIGNSDVRDYNQNVWTNTINGTTTVEVWNNQIGQRLDMQKFELAAQFATETLTSIVITDTGAANSQRAIVAGLTVQIPTPASTGLLALAGLVAARRRR